MGVGKGGLGGAVPRLDFECLAKKVVFLVSSGKNQISPFLATPGKIWEKSPSGPPGKISDAHGCQMRFVKIPAILICQQCQI